MNVQPLVECLSTAVFPVSSHGFLHLASISPGGHALPGYMRQGAVLTGKILSWDSGSIHSELNQAQKGPVSTVPSPSLGDRILIQVGWAELYLFSGGQKNFPFSRCLQSGAGLEET